METLHNVNTTYDYLLKILLVGETSSNKRALLGMYLADTEVEQKSTGTLGELWEVEFREIESGNMLLSTVTLPSSLVHLGQCIVLCVCDSC